MKGKVNIGSHLFGNFNWEKQHWTKDNSVEHAMNQPLQKVAYGISGRLLL